MPDDSRPDEIPSVDDVLAALDTVTAELPGGGEVRQGQRDMAAAISKALVTGEPVVIQAGTGTGKSLAYLTPLAMSGRRAIVATATKALQDQLVDKDLPFLASHLEKSFRYAMLKGRSNYVCLQRLAEIEGIDTQLGLDGMAADADQDQLDQIIEWADETSSGDRAELAFEPSVKTWSAVSVGPRECPGASRCPKGEECFAESARSRAMGADITVVNLHLYGLDVSSDNGILGEHDIVVIDEAHQAEDIFSASSGFDLTGGRFHALTRSVKAIIADTEVCDNIDEIGADLTGELAERVGERIDLGNDAALDRILNLARSRVERAANALRRVPDTGPGDVKDRKLRANQATLALIEDIDLALNPTESDVAWVEGPARSPSLKVAPIDVSAVLAERLWPKRTAILTSATLPKAVPVRLGVEAEYLDVGSPFDFETNALLYCATDLPEPRSEKYRDALHDELESLIVAAGGRTLALFTSYSAMHAAADAIASSLPWTVHVQGELPKPALIEAFTSDEEACLFATMSFWQGIDVPGPTLSLVTIDKLPFPRPDDPLLQARRDLEGRAAFRTIDLPRAATLLAQGAGRLIRSANDRGVVAVLDSRLATAKSYRWDIINALPPMRRTRDRTEVEAFLRDIRETQ